MLKLLLLNGGNINEYIALENSEEIISTYPLFEAI